MKLTLNEVKVIYSALVNLNGGQTIVETKDGKQTAIVKPYDLSGKTIWNLAKNTKLFQSEVKVFNEARDSLIRRISGGQNEIDQTNKAHVAQYYEEMEKMGAQETEVTGVLKINVSDLNLDSTKIHHTLLVDLMPILDGDVK